MPKVVLEAAEGGITLSPELLEEAGVRPGDRVQVELVALPDEEGVRHRAILYTARKLGNAILVGTPVWRDGEWQAELRSPDGALNLGLLTLDEQGTVIPEKSATLDSVSRSHDASRAVPEAA